MIKYYCSKELLRLVPNIILFYWNQKNKTLKKHKNIKELVINTRSRSSTILPIFKYCLFKVYNGHKYVKVSITEKRFFYKLGEFSFTKIPARHNKKKNKSR